MSLNKGIDSGKERRKHDVRFLRQYENFDIYVATNLTHIYGVYGEGEDQYIPVFFRRQ